LKSAPSKVVGSCSSVVVLVGDGTIAAAVVVLVVVLGVGSFGWFRLFLLLLLGSTGRFGCRRLCRSGSRTIGTIRTRTGRRTNRPARGRCRSRSNAQHALQGRGGILDIHCCLFVFLLLCVQEDSSCDSCSNMVSVVSCQDVNKVMVLDGSDGWCVFGPDGSTHDKMSLVGSIDRSIHFHDVDLWIFHIGFR
jgi:hypothetical protein